MEGLDNETLKKGGIHILCPICFEKKRQEESVMTACCGQDICEMCDESHRAECTRKSLKYTCMYCRAKVVSKKKLNPLLHKQADEGKDWAQNELGYKYLKGLDGFDRNVREGVRYIQMAGEKGCVQAQYNMGILYEKGEGVPQDWEKSFYWHLQSANQGYARAQFNVGNAYFFGGQGVDKDIDQAFIWWKKSADLEYHWGQYNLGVLYLNGQGAPKDEDKALNYFLLAADQGDMDAIYLASYIYCNRYKKEGTKHIYNAIYYCRKFIKLSETKEFDKAKKDLVIKELSSLSSVCRVCSKKGKRYKCCSKCTCVYYCSVDCQKKDWKENGHKEECRN